MDTGDPKVGAERIIGKDGIGECAHTHWGAAPRELLGIFDRQIFRLMKSCLNLPEGKSQPSVCSFCYHSPVSHKQPT